MGTHKSQVYGGLHVKGLICYHTVEHHPALVEERPPRLYGRGSQICQPCSKHSFYGPIYEVFKKAFGSVLLGLHHFRKQMGEITYLNASPCLNKKTPQNPVMQINFLSQIDNDQFASVVLDFAITLENLKY